MKLNFLGKLYLLCFIIGLISACGQNVQDNTYIPSDGAAKINSGLCALRAHNSTQAETYFRQALQKNPKFPRALFRMAELSYEQKYYTQAYEYLQRYIEIAKHTPQTLWLGIRIERALNNRSTAASTINHDIFHLSFV